MTFCAKACKGSPPSPSQKNCFKDGVLNFNIEAGKGLDFDINSQTSFKIGMWIGHIMTFFVYYYRTKHLPLRETPPFMANAIKNFHIFLFGIFP